MTIREVFKPGFTVEYMKKAQLQTQGVKQDGSREWISVLSYICADSTHGPPTLIYQGKSFDLQSSWIEDVDEKEEAYFAASVTGWTNNSLGIQWLERVFNRHTREKARGRRRLLLLDGHSSHVNMAFLNLADKMGIITLILPPHSTHRLQPLDIGLFGPLSKAYSKELNRLIHISQGMVSMSKRFFWPLFNTAWKSAFTPVNIASAFAATGVWRLNPGIILDKMKSNSTPLREAPKTLKTPLTSRGIRSLQKRLKQNPKDNKILTQLFSASERLAALNSVMSHEIDGLITAIHMEKKKRNQGKRLNLLGEEAGGPQLFSPGQIIKAKARILEKEEEERQKRVAIDVRKELQAIIRAEKAKEKEDRAIAMALKRQIQVEETARKAKEREELKEAKKKAKEALAVIQIEKKSLKTPSKKRKRPISTAIDIDQEKEENPPKRNARGRNIKMPKKYQ